MMLDFETLPLLGLESRFGNKQTTPIRNQNGDAVLKELTLTLLMYCYFSTVTLTAWEVSSPRYTSVS